MFIIHRLAVLSMLLLLISSVTSLPAMMREDIEKITTTTTTATAMLVSLTTDATVGDAEKTAHAPLLVQVDRFAQLVATHWLFDHLESIKSRSYDHIATRLGTHVELLAVGSNDDNDDDDTLVDLDILKAQIFGAAQAHIGGHLPVAWDDLSGDTLSKPALERHIATLVNTHCTRTREMDQDDTAAASFVANSVDHACLLLRGDQILADLDRYVMHHLQSVFRAMDTQVMPELLKHTEKDLRQVIGYFNGVQEQQASSMQLALHVLPWHAAAAATATADQGSSSADTTTDPPPSSSFLSSSVVNDHDSHRIDQYADLAIVL